ATTGNYDLRLVDVSNPPFLPAGTDIPGQINPGSSTRAFGFTAQAGQHLFLDALGTNTAGSWQLIGPNNQAVASSNLTNDLEYDVTTSGSYVLLLSGSAAAPVPYSFRLTLSTPQSLPLAFGSINTGAIN